VQQGIQVTVGGVGGTSARFEIIHTLPDQLTQTEAEAVRDFLVDLCESKYSATGYSGGADLLTWSTV
jgi:hypothetical protein